MPRAGGNLLFFTADNCDSWKDCNLPHVYSVERVVPCVSSIGFNQSRCQIFVPGHQLTVSKRSFGSCLYSIHHLFHGVHIFKESLRLKLAVCIFVVVLKLKQFPSFSRASIFLQPSSRYLLNFVQTTSASHPPKEL